MPRVSGSQLALLRACSWWARDDAPAAPYDPPGPPARIGTAAHRMIENFLVSYQRGASPGAVELADLDLGDDQFAAARRMADAGIQWAVDTMGDGIASCESEVAFAYNTRTRTARRLTARERRYDIDRSCEIPCTLDVVRVTGKFAEVIDWKSGRAAHVEASDDNAQLLLGALCVARAHGVDEVRASIVRLGDGTTDEPAREDAALYTDLEIDAFETELCRLYNGIQTSLPVVGEHCSAKYCKQLGQCPATSAALVTVSGSDPAFPVVTDPARITSPEHAAWLVRAVKLAQSISFKAEAALRSYAQTHGGKINLGDGRVYGPEPGASRIATHVALPVLADEGLDLDLAAPRAATRDTVSEALKAQPGPVAPRMRRVMAKLGEAGALVSQGEKWSVHREG